MLSIGRRFAARFATEFPGPCSRRLLCRPTAAPNTQQKYVVLNSGPTFRDAHDQTNSQQNPKLPDWAIIDIHTPPDADHPGKIAAAGFFGEGWALDLQEQEAEKPKTAAAP